MGVNSGGNRVRIYRVCGGLGLLLAFLAAMPARADDTAPLKAVDQNQVAIPRGSLGKEFMLSASIIPQAGAPTSTGLAGRIVTFELFPDGVDMYESPQGQIVTTDLPARRLLTTFPIVSQDEQQVVIDFNQGMNRVITEGWYSSGRSRGDDLARTLEVPQSRVFAVETSQDRLVIRQAAQVRDRQFDANQEARYEIRYFVAPYKAVEGFSARENLGRDTRYVRYFQSQPQLELNTGRASAKIARFDIRQPIQFYYSVKAGVLYWNRAFGQELVKVDKAPDGVTAPSVDHNIVQWVPWDDAGFAYADLLIDPRTGQSLHGQVYLTSVFAFGGKQRARAILRNMRSRVSEEKKEGDDKHTPQLGIHFLRPVCSCDCDMKEFAWQMVTGLEAVLATPDASEAKILQASQDYVCGVTAHEIGHVLGLRHNFAGSLEANVTHAELEKWFEDYLTKDELPEMKDKYTTSSVMEYSMFQAAVFNGWKIRTTSEVFPHDKAAIQWGYFESAEAKEKKLLFGTDDNVGTYGDVRTFDYGSEPVAAAFADISNTLKTLPQSVIETFIQNKAPLDPRDQVPLEEVNLSPNMRAAMLASAHSSIFQWFQSGTRSLRLERDYPFVGPLNQEDIAKTRWEKLNGEVKELGGVDRILFSYLPVSLTLNLKDAPKGVTPPEKVDAAKLTEELAKLLDSPTYSSFVGADGKTYSFTDEEKKLIKERGKLFFEAFEKEFLLRACQNLGRASRDLGVEATGSVSDDDIVAQFEKQVVALGKAIIMAKDESKIRRGKLNRGTVEVTDYKYDPDTRMAAAQMLTDAVGSYRSWSKDARGSIHNELKGDIEGSLNINALKAFSESQLSRPLRDWYLEQQRLLSLIPPAPPSPSGGPMGASSTSDEGAAASENSGQ
jgi:hypothetical protein